MRHIFGAKTDSDAIMVPSHCHPIKIADVTASTEGTRLGTGHDHMADRRIIRPEGKLVAQGDRHVKAEGIQRLRTIEQNKPCLPFN
jgi:hypothetical protein